MATCTTSELQSSKRTSILQGDRLVEDNLWKWNLDSLEYLCHSIGSKPLAHCLVLRLARQGNLMYGVVAFTYILETIDNL